MSDSNFDSQYQHQVQLQQELLQLFELDTEKYLQLYEETIQNLSAKSWREQIHQIYRCVHTIKGGAVTVGAEPLLQIATVLEDLLSDLRYLEVAPNLEDGKLQQILTEAGELLIGSIHVAEVPRAAIARIEALRVETKTRYLPKWNEYTLLCQEFAEQGFDLMVLDLEIGLETLAPDSQIPDRTISAAKQAIEQLREVGNDLQLGKDWNDMLAQSQEFFQQLKAPYWLERWTPYLKSLKECAKHGGVLSNQFAIEPSIPFITSSIAPEFAPTNLTPESQASPNLAKPNSAKSDFVPPHYPELSEQTFAIDLDRELLDLFALDTQKDLHIYVDTVAKLSTEAWTQDIQQLYRSVHTIKGGSVTVGAQNVLEVSTVLEDLLSDLRHLETAPPLANGKLKQTLTEAGELLIGSLQSTDSDNALRAVKRIQVLHEEIKQEHLSEWNEQKQLFKEFAEQGFDLVTLELEMAIEQLPAQGNVPASAIKIAQQTLMQLSEIGDELGFAPEWSDRLLPQGSALIANPDLSVWLTEWMSYLRSLKEAAKLGGCSPKPPAKPQISLPVAPAINRGTEKLQGKSTPDLAPSKSPAKRKTATAPLNANIQIPVPLERLDRSSQYLVETLLATRSTQGFFQSMQSNLMPLVALAQDSVQYISQLREVQDDFALSEASSSQDGLKVERYRQGYLAINRLLEISLRLIELGAETGDASRRTSESLLKLDLSLRSLQQTLEESRLLPFEALSFRARGILRDLMTRVGKPAQMSVRGEKLELDAGTLRNLEPIFLHLIRNAYDHGLESPEERISKGKPEQGKIDISLIRRGNVFLLEIKDDGKGIDPAQISKIAQSKGLPLIDTSTPTRLLEVLSQSGFTSAQAVSDISGRGVGMDVVASQVESLGGQLRLHSIVGVGTNFTIQIPVPQLFVRCMLLQAGDRIFAIPTAEVFTTMLLSDLIWKQVEAKEHKPYTIAISENNIDTPALELAQYWQGSSEARTFVPNAIAVRVKRLEDNQGVWLIADNLVGQSDLLVSPLPPPLIAPVGIVGVNLTSEGSLIPVLDGLSLIDALLNNLTGDFTSNVDLPQMIRSDKSMLTPSVTDGLSGRQIIVVDDAALMRRRIESSLSAQGYNVRTCSDGQEAWELLQVQAQPSILITDIEMPRMDGFTLIDQCRQAGMDMPILVISSRLAEEWSKETKRLGATDYLTKGFSTTELLQKVASLLDRVNPQPLGI
jgi:chemotaxis protein histidine kinase CheA/ActR/RegA family two-component response regulator